MSKTPMETTAQQFDSLSQQYEADTLGTWTFLATEILLFGGLFLAYAVARSLHPEAWAEASGHNNLLIGTVNTAVLLMSSLAMALAVYFAELKRWQRVQRLLLVTVSLGGVFLALKFYEYYEHYAQGLIPGEHFAVEGADAAQQALFFFFYFTMTGLHALHMVVGIALLGGLVVRIRRQHLDRAITVELCGLYWHLVDVIWVFLYPMLYLI